MIQENEEPGKGENGNRRGPSLRCCIERRSPICSGSTGNVETGRKSLGQRNIPVIALPDFHLDLIFLKGLS